MWRSLPSSGLSSWGSSCSRALSLLLLSAWLTVGVAGTATATPTETTSPTATVTVTETQTATVTETAGPTELDGQMEGVLGLGRVAVFGVGVLVMVGVAWFVIAHSRPPTYQGAHRG